jgi:hypothetical protein
MDYYSLFDTAEYRANCEKVYTKEGWFGGEKQGYKKAIRFLALSEIEKYFVHRGQIFANVMSHEGLPESTRHKVKISNESTKIKLRALNTLVDICSAWQCSELVDEYEAKLRKMQNEIDRLELEFAAYRAVDS